MQARIAKGISAGNTILQILNEECFGPYETEVFLRLRESLMMSTLLFNAETWFGVTKKEIEQLENVDLRFLRQKFELHSKIPKEMIFLELGIVPVNFLLMKKRLEYLQYILQQPEESLIHQVLMAMIKNPQKNDWIESIRKDMKDLNIQLTFKNIKDTTKEKFKAFLKKVIEEKAFEHLSALKETHSKMADLKYRNLKMQNYLKSEAGFSNSDVNFALNLRSNILKVKANFCTAQQAGNINCRGCTENKPENQEHIFYCPSLNANSLDSEDSTKYNDLFSEDPIKILEVTSRMKNVFNKLQELVNSPSEPVYVASSTVNSVSAALSNRADPE